MQECIPVNVNFFHRSSKTTIFITTDTYLMQVLYMASNNVIDQLGDLDPYITTTTTDGQIYIQLLYIQAI